MAIVEERAIVYQSNLAVERAIIDERNSNAKRVQAKDGTQLFERTELRERTIFME